MDWAKPFGGFNSFDAINASSAFESLDASIFGALGDLGAFAISFFSTSVYLSIYLPIPIHLVPI